MDNGVFAAAIAIPVPRYRMLDRRLRQARGRRGPAPIDEVIPGDVVLVRPGERIPVDGEAADGRSAVDDSMSR